MKDPTDAHSQLSLTPLGAGDLIDRAVRLYRKNFWTFILIAAPPVLIGTVVSIGWQALARFMFSVDSVNNPAEAGLYEFFMFIGTVVIWIVELIVAFSVMGGASRNFVRHLLFGEPMTFRETYRNLRSRFFGLLGASVIVTFLLCLIGTALLTFGYIVAAVLILIIVLLLSDVPIVATVISIVVGVAALFGTGWLFFLIAGNFMYVPQAMLVEGQKISAAIGRSSSLARGNATRTFALFGFTLLATLAAMALLFVPLGWYATVQGIDLMSFGDDALPAWYEIANQFVGQASLILLLPVWMIGLCLLYVDERVRHEGYDIELMAARRLGEIPAVPKEFVNPLQPALAVRTKIDAPAPKSKGGGSILGLE